MKKTAIFALEYLFCCMKIIYIYTALLTKGGADRVITEKANWLAEHGHDVTIVTDTQLGREPVFALSPKVKLHDLAIDFSKEYGHILLLRAWWYFVLMRRYKKALCNFLCNERPDIVVTTLGRELDFLPYIKDDSVKVGESHIARKYSRNFHLMEQKGGAHKLLVKIWRKKQEKDVSRLDGLVLLTHQDADSWKGVTRTFVIPNSLPFYPNRISKCDNKRAICVGRLNEQKGYEYLIDAWSLVTKKHPDWKLDVFGDGEIRTELQDRINSKGLNKCFFLKAPVSAIMEEYLDSSLYIMSSRYEGFGMVLIEAMACGLPCVSFDCPYGPSDIIKNGEDGYLIEYLNTQALADGICKLIEDDELRREMGRRGRTNVLRFSRENVMQQWVDLFESLKNMKGVIK